MATSGEAMTNTSAKAERSDDQREIAIKDMTDPKDDPSGDVRQGFTYKFKLLTLLLLGAASNETKFRLATETLEDSDDIVLEYEGRDGQPMTALIRCQPSDEEHRTIGFEDIRCLRAKAESSIDKNRIQRVVLYTRINIDADSKADERLAEVAAEDEIAHILHFGGFKKASSAFYEIVGNISSFGKSSKRASLEQFPTQFLLAVNQPSEAELEDVIEAELGDGLRVRNSRSALSELNRFSRTWVSNTVGKFVTRETAEAFVADLKTRLRDAKTVGAIFENPEKRLEFGNFFKTTEQLESDLASTPSPLIYVESTSPSLTVVKLVQALTKDDANFVALNVRTLLASAEEVKSAFASKPRFTVVVECSPLNEDETEEARNLIDELVDVSAKSDKFAKKIVLVKEERDDNLPTLDRGFRLLRDESKGEDIANGALDRMLRRTVVFQGYEMKLGDVVGEAGADLLDGLVLSHLVDGQRVRVGKPLPDLGDTNGSYVDVEPEMLPNHFTEKHDDKSAEEIEAIIDNHTKVKVRMLKGEQGAGKSTALTKMASKRKERNPEVFVIRLNVIDLVRHLRQIDKMDHDQLCDVFAATERMDTAFERSLLRHRLFQAGEVELFLDGFDEVASSDRERVKTFQTFFINVTRVRKIWMTTRPSVDSRGERYAATYGLPAIDSGDQRRFLRNFWTRSSKTEDHGAEKYVEDFARQLLERLRDEGGVRHFDQMRIGIALRLTIVARTFQGQCRAFCEGQGQMGPQLSDLLRRFVDDPFGTYVEETTQLHRPTVRRSAFRWLFPSHVSKGEDADGDPAEWPDVGSSPYLDHRVFAEFFAAELVAEQLTAGDVSPQLTDFLSRNYLLEDHFCFSRFLDLALARESALHLAAARNEAKRVKELVEEDRSRLLLRDAMGRVPLHLACLYSAPDASETLDYLVSEDVRQETGPSQIVAKDMFDFCPYAYAFARGSTTRTHLRLGWSYFETHPMFDLLDENLLGAKVERLKFMLDKHEEVHPFAHRWDFFQPRNESESLHDWSHSEAPMSAFWTSDELLEYASTSVDDGGLQRSRSFGALRPRFYRLCQAEQMELLGENDHELLKPALRSYFWDVACLRLSKRKFLRGVDADGAGCLHDWFWEAIREKDYPFLLGITLACPQTARKLWTTADPQRAFLELIPDEKNDTKLRNYLALLLRLQLGCEGDHPLSPLRCVGHFRRLAMEDNVGFKISLSSVNDRDRHQLMKEVEIGLKDEILRAASDKKPVKLYNAFLYMKDYGHGDWTHIAAAINANSRVCIDYFRECLERRDVVGFNHLLVYALRFLDKRRLDKAVKNALGKMKLTTYKDTYVVRASALTGDSISKLCESLELYPSAVARGYPYSLTQHVVSQIVWIDAGAVPPMIRAYFDDRDVKLDFVSQVAKAVERGEIDDVCKFLDFSSDEEARTLLRSNDFQIVKLCLRSGSFEDVVGRSRWTFENVKELGSFVSEGLKNEIANLDALKDGMLRALEARNFRSLEFLGSFLSTPAKKRFWEEADYASLYRDALRRADHDLVIGLGKALGAANVDTSALELDKLKHLSKAFDENVAVYNRLMRKLGGRNAHFSDPKSIEGFRRAVVDVDFEGLAGFGIVKTEQPYAFQRMMENVETKDYVRYLQEACRLKSVQGLRAFMTCIRGTEAESVENFMKSKGIELNYHRVYTPSELQDHQWGCLGEYVDQYLSALDRGLPGSFFQYVYYGVVCVTQAVEMPASVAAYLRGTEAVGTYLEEILKLKRNGEFKELCAWFSTASADQRKLILGANDREILKDAFRSDYFDELLISTDEHGHKDIRSVSSEEVLELDEYVESVSEAIRKSQFGRLKRLTEFLHHTKKMQLMDKADFKAALANALAAKEHEWVRDFATQLMYREKQRGMFTSKDFELYLNEVCLDDVEIFKAIVGRLSNEVLDKMLTKIDYVGAFRNAAERTDGKGLVQLFEIYGQKKECLDKVGLGVKSELFLEYCKHRVLNKRIRFVVPCLRAAEKKRFNALVRLRCTFLEERDFETKDEKAARESETVQWSCCDSDEESSTPSDLETEPEKIELSKKGEKRLIELMERYPSAVARGYPWSVFHFVSCAAVCFAESKPLPGCIAVYFEPRDGEKPVDYVEEMKKAKDEETHLWFLMATVAQRKEIRQNFVRFRDATKDALDI